MSGMYRERPDLDLTDRLVNADSLLRQEPDDEDDEEDDDRKKEDADDDEEGDLSGTTTPNFFILAISDM